MNSFSLINKHKKIFYNEQICLVFANAVADESYNIIMLTEEKLNLQAV